MNTSPSTDNDRVHITGRPANDTTGSHPGPDGAAAVVAGAVVAGAVVEVEVEVEVELRGAAVVADVDDGSALVVGEGAVVPGDVTWLGT